jgi:sulfur-oxidizing protein SoxA
VSLRTLPAALVGLLTLALLSACGAPPSAGEAGRASQAVPSTQTTGAGAPAPAAARRSGFADMSAATQAMQHDDAANPAWLWVEEGRQRFATGCARCHEAAAMAGVAARHPAWDEVKRRPFTLGQRIAMCQSRNAESGGQWLRPDSEARIALETFVALQSRGQPIAPPPDPRLAPWRERGRALFAQRFGQLDLSCAQCHEQHAGQRLAGSVIPQGHATGYPIYRLEWQGMGTLQRRVRGCLTGVRAEPFGWDSDEMTSLEVYLAARAAGLPMETPAVRP